MKRPETIEELTVTRDGLREMLAELCGRRIKLDEQFEDMTRRLGDANIKLAVALVNAGPAIPNGPIRIAMDVSAEGAA